MGKTKPQENKDYSQSHTAMEWWVRLIHSCNPIPAHLPLGLPFVRRGQDTETQHSACCMPSTAEKRAEGTKQGYGCHELLPPSAKEHFLSTTAAFCQFLSASAKAGKEGKCHLLRSHGWSLHNTLKIISYNLVSSTLIDDITAILQTGRIEDHQAKKAAELNL